MAISGDNVYITGNFSSIAGVAVANVAVVTKSGSFVSIVNGAKGDLKMFSPVMGLSSGSNVIFIPAGVGSIVPGRIGPFISISKTTNRAINTRG